MWWDPGRAGENWWRVWRIWNPYGEDPGPAAGKALFHQDISCHGLFP